MTQKYYCQKLLPFYIEAVKFARSRIPTDAHSQWYLQEDNDPSHGKRSRGLAEHLREQNSIPKLHHPGNSPDLNPMEGIWSILKQRVSRRAWNDIEELKGILQEEWDQITQEEIQARIREMPERCKYLVETGGAPYKSSLW